MLLNRSFPLVQAAAMDVCDQSLCISRVNCAFGPEGSISSADVAAI